MSVLDGSVKEVGTDRVYGNYAVIDHGDGATTKYGHMQKPSLLKEGNVIEKGTIIGNVGSTGRSTGPHLHFECRVNGEIVDPFDSIFSHGSVILSRKEE